MGKHRERQVYQQLIEAVYRRWNETKLSDVPRLMEKYKGQEAEIYDVVVRKYVFCAGKSEWLPLIEIMYKRFNPSKLQDIDRILDKYKDSEAALYRALCDKYIPQLKSGEAPLDADAWAGLGTKAPVDNGGAPDKLSLDAAPKARERDDHSLPRMSRAEDKQKTKTPESAGASEAMPEGGKEKRKEGRKEKDPAKRKEKKDKKARKERPGAASPAAGVDPLSSPRGRAADGRSPTLREDDGGAAALLAAADAAKLRAADAYAVSVPEQDPRDAEGSGALQADAGEHRHKQRRKRRRESAPDAAAPGEAPPEAESAALAGVRRKRRRREKPADAGAGRPAQTAVKEEPHDQDQARDAVVAAQLRPKAAPRRPGSADGASPADAAGHSPRPLAGVAAAVGGDALEAKRRVHRRRRREAAPGAEPAAAQGGADPRRSQGGVQEAALEAAAGDGAQEDAEDALRPAPPPPASLPNARVVEDELAQQRSAREALLRAKLLEARRMRAEAMARAGGEPPAPGGPAGDGARQAMEFSWGGAGAPAVAPAGGGSLERPPGVEASNPSAASTPRLVLRGSREAELRARALRMLKGGAAAAR